MGLALIAPPVSGGSASHDAQPVAAATAPEACEERVPVLAGGRVRRTICAADTPRLGLTLLDLSDDWTPAAFAPAPDGSTPSYAATYVALANERFAEAGGERAAAEEDRYLELHGIHPSLSVVRSRLADSARHACHDLVDGGALAQLAGAPAEEERAAALARRERARTQRASLEREATRLGVADLEALAALDDRHARRVALLRDRETYLEAVRAAQAHLACDGLLPSARVDGLFDWRTGEALAGFQRRHLLRPAARLDGETRAALALDSRELDLRTALRVLRERVIAATGLIEDGTAGAGPALVAGRALAPAWLAQVPGAEPLPDAAVDLVGAATDAAARAMGWSDPATTLAFLDALARGESPARVAVELPPLPDYHGSTMDLAVEIDRGDVWYDPAPRSRPIERRPALILYARQGERKIALVRWPTTIGGWQEEKLRSGTVVKRFKDSPVGPRLWRDLYLGPVWLPPDSTPDEELVRAIGGGRHALKRETIGPSYRSAYGLAMLVHHLAVERHGQIELEDQEVRTHGSGNLLSIHQGRSHGCHRLLGFEAIRLAGFLIQHREHIHHGPEPTWYRRVFQHHGSFRVLVTTRGDRIELVPPVPVDVLPGRIRSRRTRPPAPAAASVPEP